MNHTRECPRPESGGRNGQGQNKKKRERILEGE